MIKTAEPIHDPWYSPDGELLDQPDLETLLKTNPQYREICEQVAHVMSNGNKTIRVTLVTSVEMLWCHVAGMHRDTSFLPDDEEGGAK